MILISLAVDKAVEKQGQKHECDADEAFVEDATFADLACVKDDQAS